MRVLITSGPTREPIDDVRFVSNVSTGRLGVAVAEAFRSAGHEVLFLHGIGSLVPSGAPGLRTFEFESAASLLALIERLVEDPTLRPDAMIHAAAVADYAPVKVVGKIKSDRKELVIEMQPTPKIADRVKQLRPDLPLILFKLESCISRDELHARARRTLERAGADAIVANLLEEVEVEKHRADLLRKDGTSTVLGTRAAIGAGLVAEAVRLTTYSTRGERVMK
jgi:phosphopantothenoylcysteine decarboxylase/phosphopantothenate--cysteine ligase